MKQEYFNNLVDNIIKKLKKDEILLINATGEESDFVRFNNNKIRQPGFISQDMLSLHLINGEKHSKDYITIGLDPDDALMQAADALNNLRNKIKILPDDPHLFYSEDINSSTYIRDNDLPDCQSITENIMKECCGTDLVGIFAGGKISCGFANSLGQRNWFETNNFNFDWSFYHEKDKAVKSSYSGFSWDNELFSTKAAHAKMELETLKRPAHTINPGKYRVYLAPAAIKEFVTMMMWGGFGLKSHKTKTTCFLKMIEMGDNFNPVITITENTAEGIAPSFQSEGFIKPDSVSLIKDGVINKYLISPRSAKEYGEVTNGANSYEMPESIDMNAGSIKQEDILKKLDRGVYINNAFYLNFSDRPAGKVTGMTRFATFWVEDGEIKAPLNVMRFDEILSRIFGNNLIGLTKNRSFNSDPGTYQQRSVESVRLPGALVEDFMFTL